MRYRTQTAEIVEPVTRKGKMGIVCLPKVVRCLGMAAVVAIVGSSAETAWAVPKETSAEKAERLHQQASPGLFNAWTFDRDTVGEVPKGFVVMATGQESGGTWKIEAQSGSPSSPHVLVGTSQCATCVELLVAQGFQYEYPELVLRLHQGSQAASGQVGVVFGLKDQKNFYATVVDLAQQSIEVVRVIDGNETVIGRGALKVKPVEWHTLRVQRNTIISKDFIETFFDGRLALSVEDQTLGVGQIGLMVRGEIAARFDNFNAAPLYSSRPLSAPAAY
ncbi:hypothetical protein FBQ96_01075 [Nitrospirales bacterium NOB]|nr:hypothetical protein [Nitrospirales bacterium NOB]